MSYGSYGPAPDLDQLLDQGVPETHTPELAPVDAPTDPYAEFWRARPMLTHLRDFARARRVGPWSVLGVVLVRAAAATPPGVHLPPLVGGTASLNLFAALVGPSGGGKGASESAAAEAVTFLDQWGRPVDVDMHPVGSGEGIARTFRPAGTDPEEPNPVESAIFTAAEVDTLAALGGRTGSTLMPQLRQLYSGETIGFSNAGKDTRVTVPRHTYRAGLIVGVQPLKAGALLDDADGGTPQRFVWAPVGDPAAPDTPPTDPGPLTVTVGTFGATHTMAVPQIAREVIDAHQLAKLRGEVADPLEGHGLLCRLKVAAALAVLDGRVNVNADDWELSATVMEISTDTRTACTAAIADKARAANRARARADAERAEIIDSTRADKAVKRVAGVIHRRLSRVGEPLSRADLRRAVSGDDRKHFDPALDVLTEEGIVTVARSGRGETITLHGEAGGWRGGDPSTPVETPPDQRKQKGGDPSTPPPQPPTSMKESA